MPWTVVIPHAEKSARATRFPASRSSGPVHQVLVVAHPRTHSPASASCAASRIALTTSLARGVTDGLQSAFMASQTYIPGCPWDSMNPGMR